MKTDVRQDTTERFEEILERLFRDSYSNLLGQWHSLDITIPQARIIDILDRRGPMRMTSLAEEMGHTLSATSSLVDRLADKGLIQREHANDDRRAVICDLSPAGRSAQRRFYSVTNTRLGRQMGSFSREQLESMIQSFEMLYTSTPDDQDN